MPEYSKQTQLQLPGNDPQAQPPQERDVAGHDVITAGRELMSGADALKHIQHQQNNVWIAQQASKLAIDENKAYFQAQNSAQPDATDFAKNHEADIRKRVQDATESAPNPRAAQQLIQHLQPWIASRVETAQHWEIGTARFATAKGLDQASNDGASAVFTADPASRETAANNVLAQQTLAVDNSALTPEEKYNAKHTLIDRVARAGVAGDTRDNPSAAVDYLLNRNSTASTPDSFLRTLRQTGTTAEESFIEATRQAESGGKTIGSHGPESSAYGAYGITKGWWASAMAAHPELKLTEQDRFSDFKQHEAMQAVVGDYSKALTSSSIKPSFTNLYMAHFLGMGGAVSFINGVKDNPNIDARAYVSDAAAKANPAVFNGRTAGEVYQLYARKFGGAEESPSASAPAYYKLLSASERESLYQQAHAAAQHKNTLAEAAFGQLRADTLSKAITLGANQPLTQSQFVDTYGVDRGVALYSQYQTEHEVALTSYKLNGLVPRDAQQLVDSLKPSADSPGYDQKYKIWAGLADQHAKNMQAISADSPEYLTDPSRPQNKAVADAYKAVRENMTPATTAAYAATLDSAQARMGIPVGQRQLLSKSYMADIASQIDSRLKASQDPKVMQATIDAYKGAWGPLWDRIYPEIKGHLAPVVEVTSSGVDAYASQLLLGVADKSAEQLAKDVLPVDERKTLSDQTIALFQTFARSTGGDTEGVKSVNTFAEQARKLAVIYRSQGLGLSDASEKAYQELIGKHYKFYDKVRVPVAADFPGLERELYDAKSRLPDLLAGPTVKNPFGEDTKLPASFMIQRARAYTARNGEWLTEPGNKGVVLLIGGQPVPRADGSPIFFTWKDLREAKSAREAKAEATNTAFRETPLPVE